MTLCVLARLVFVCVISETTMTAESPRMLMERQVGMPWRSTRGAEIRYDGLALGLQQTKYEIFQDES